MIYIACPMSVPQHTLDEVKLKLLKKYNLTSDQVYYWYRHLKYDPHDLDKAEACVIILENNGFYQDMESIPMGTRNEIKKFHTKGLPVLLAYRLVTTNEYAFYLTEIEYGRFTGIGGSQEKANTIIESLYIEHFVELDNQPTSQAKVSLESFWF